MASFKNTTGITSITFEKLIHNFCPLGEDWYTNNIVVQMVPGDLLPDYIDIDAMFDEIDTKHLIIEEVVAQVFDYLKSTYEPKYMKVTSYVDDAVHLPVTVEKETL